MKIGQPSDNLISVSTAASAAPSKAAQTAPASASATAAKSPQSAGVAVTVSNLARSMSTSKSSDTADIDMAKVNSVRSAIAQGTFKVNPEAIADKLLANAQEMLDRTRV